MENSRGFSLNESAFFSSFFFILFCLYYLSLACQKRRKTKKEEKINEGFLGFLSKMLNNVGSQFHFLWHGNDMSKSGPADTLSCHKYCSPVILRCAIILEPLNYCFKTHFVISLQEAKNPFLWFVMVL